MGLRTAGSAGIPLPPRFTRGYSYPTRAEFSLAEVDTQAVQLSPVKSMKIQSPWLAFAGA